MKTRLLLWAVIILLPNLFFAQIRSQQVVAPGGNPQVDLNTLLLPFTDLDKSKIASGLLLDAGIEFADLQKYNGIPTDSSYTSSKIIGDIYSTLIMSKISSNGGTLKNPTDFQNEWYQSQAPDLIPIGGEYFKYNQFSQSNQTAFQNMAPNLPTQRTTDISTGSLIITPQNKILDVYTNGVWQNPYDTNKLFAMAPIYNGHNKLNFNVIFPSNLFLSNYGGEVSTLEVKFSESENYQLITMDQIIPVSYISIGDYTWTYKLTLTNGQVLYSKNKFSVKNDLEKYVDIGNQDPSIVPSNNFSNLGQFIKVVLQNYTYALPVPPFAVTRPKLTLYIKLKEGQTQITKPLIIAEGFDTGHITNPRQEAGENNIEDFISTANQYNQLNLKFNEYDIIYVDWGIGTDYIQSNAELFKKAIRWVNQNKIGTEKNVVMGQSMGGLIARYALKDMEDNGENHNANLFISHDAPHLGANTPLSIQYMMRTLSKKYLSSPIVAGINYVFTPIFTGGAPISEVLTLTDTPASRQMLINYVNSNLIIDNSFHNTWQTTLKTKGYPQLTRNVAISNGSECGTDQNIQDLVTLHHTSKGWFIDILGALIGGLTLDADQIILSLIPGKSRYYYDFIARPMTTINENKQLYYGKIVYKKDILWVIPSQHTIFSATKNQPTAVLPIDKYGGGKFRFPVSSIPSWLGLGDHLMATDFSFVPTPSALDYKLGNSVLTEDDYQKTFSPVDDATNVPFVNFVAEQVLSYRNENNDHINFSLRNSQFILNQLTFNPAIQDQKLTTSYLCGSKVKIGGESLLCGNANATYTTGFAPTIQWSALIGSNLIDITGPTNQSQFSFTPKNNVNGLVKLQAYLAGGGTSNTVTKDIWIGKPSIYASPSSNNTNYVTFNIEGTANTQPELQGLTPSNVIWKRLDNGDTRTGFSYFANAPGHNWSFDVEIKATNSCGTFTTYATITPPPPVDCDTYTLVKTESSNNYTILKSVDPDCPINPIPNRQFDEYQIKVANSMGTIVISKTGNNFDLSSFPAGMYVVNISKDNETIINQTLIKN